MTFGEAANVALVTCVITTMWVIFGLAPDRERSFAMNGAMVVDGVKYRVMEDRVARQACELKPFVRRAGP